MDINDDDSQCVNIVTNLWEYSNVAILPQICNVWHSIAGMCYTLFLPYHHVVLCDLCIQYSLSVHDWHDMV